MRDICGEWQRATQKYNLPFGLSEHLGASFSWWRVNKLSDRHGPYAGVPYDGNDPAYRDFYHDNAEHLADGEASFSPWYTSNVRFQQYWLDCIREVIDRFHPDLCILMAGSRLACRSSLRRDMPTNLLIRPIGRAWK